MRWIPVTECLPEIPKGKYGIKVLVCQYDCIYDEDSNDCTNSNGRGLSVSTASYSIIDYEKMPMFKGSIFEDGKPEFMDIYFKGDGGYEWGLPCDQITHWMYFPSPPEYETKYNKEKDILEFVYIEEPEYESIHSIIEKRIRMYNQEKSKGVINEFVN